MFLDRYCCNAVLKSNWWNWYNKPDKLTTGKLCMPTCRPTCIIDILSAQVMRNIVTKVKEIFFKWLKFSYKPKVGINCSVVGFVWVIFCRVSIYLRKTISDYPCQDALNVNIYRQPNKIMAYLTFHKWLVSVCNIHNDIMDSTNRNQSLGKSELRYYFIRLTIFSHSWCCFPLSFSRCEWMSKQPMPKWRYMSE